MSYAAKGGKVRQGGLAAKMQSAARRAVIASQLRDEDADAIAQRVYGTAVDLKAAAQPSPVPLAVEAPLVAAFELAAQGIVQREGLPMDEEHVGLVASYLLAASRYEMQEVTPTLLERWRERQADGDVPA